MANNPPSSRIYASYYNFTTNTANPSSHSRSPSSSAGAAASLRPTSTSTPSPPGLTLKAQTSNGKKQANVMVARDVTLGDVRKALEGGCLSACAHMRTVVLLCYIKACPNT